jgi:hypothetical protein
MKLDTMPDLVRLMIYRTVRFCHWFMIHIPIRVCTISPRMRS